MKSVIDQADTSSSMMTIFIAAFVVAPCIHLPIQGHPIFHHATLYYWVKPGDEATYMYMLVVSMLLETIFL